VTHLDGRRSYDARVVQPRVTGSAVDDPAEAEVVVLSPGGRRARLTATLAVLALLLAGTLWGTDASFPFGPFKMYSTRADVDSPVVSTRVVGLTGAGEEVRLSGGEVGLRRAEFEGQLPRLVDDPALLVTLAETYARRHPGGPALVEVQVVQRHFELADGRPTGAWTDRVLVDQDLGTGR
jgi:hypothetical protein